jgi:hypothetical protein
MNRKLQIANCVITFSIVFALLFQSIHSVEHLSQIVTEKKCVHSETAAKNNITHEHHGLEKCNLCDFTLSSVFFVDSMKPLQFSKVFYSNSFYFTFQNIDFYSGSSKTLRGPPII